jgi:hypothetical protein
LIEKKVFSATPYSPPGPIQGKLLRLRWTKAIGKVLFGRKTSEAAVVVLSSCLAAMGWFLPVVFGKGVLGLVTAFD